MSYNPENQVRASIIRGKAKSDLDNLLPAYANIISEICPCSSADFISGFNGRLGRFLSESTKKTLDNHRTEIAGKLFGMFYLDSDGIVQCSERTKAFIKNTDQPFFFKDICSKFQFPNGMDSINTVMEKTANKLSIRQFPYILKLLSIAAENEILISKDEIAYYVLNSLDVLQGGVDPDLVLQQIVEGRKAGIMRRVEHPGKASSYSMQHINEQLNLLELANLVKIKDGCLYLNSGEKEAVEFLASKFDSAPGFDVYSYDFERQDERKRFYKEWDLYYGKLSDGAGEKFVTHVESLEFSALGKEGFSKPLVRPSTVELGDEGELYVYQLEKERVGSFNPRLVNKIRLFGKTKGLGYDIQSVVAERGEEAEFVRYLEVKSTKRVTAPSLGDSRWVDTLNITRNEWVALQQHRHSYHIYRVYFTSEGVIIFVIKDPYEKIQNEKILAMATNYRLDFQSSAVDQEIN